MIRLIATDLDGTLLEKDGTLPEGIFDRIRRLKKAGIAFAAASGRQYTNVRRLFLPVAEDMLFICENGALCVREDGSLDTTEIPERFAREIMEDILGEGMDLLISGARSAYVLDTNRPFADTMIYGLRNTTTVLHSLEELPERPIKISGRADASRLGEISGRFLSKWQGKVSGAVAGAEWFDFTLANKGTGVQKLMESLGIPREETAAFGDQFNDEPMLDAVGHPFVALGGPAGMKKPGYTVFEKELNVLDQILEGTLY